MARFSAMFLPERSGFGLNELLDGASLYLRKNLLYELFRVSYPCIQL